MPVPNQASSTTPWSREALAGSVGAIAVLPVVLTYGLLAFGPLGAAAPGAGIFAAFVSAVIGGLLHALLSRNSLPAAGPSLPTALTLAALVAHLAADPRLALAGPLGVAGIVALCGGAVLLSGALQIGMALLGMARLARIVPQPVLAGFMNSAALLVLLSQVPLLLDLPLGSLPDPADWRTLRWGGIALGVGTAGVIWWLARQGPRLPAALIGLLAGTAAQALWEALAGASAPVTRLGELPVAWPWPPAWWPLPPRGLLELLQAHAAPMLATALALASLGALESSLNLRAIDQLLHSRHDPRRELIALGCGNLVSGLFGGVPLVATRTRALATLQAGGQRRLAVLVGALMLGLLYGACGPLLARLPLSVLAGVMLVVAVGLADRWSGRLLLRWWSGDRSPDLLLGLLVMALVVATTLWQGMPAGIALGMLLSLVAFALRMNRSLVQERYRASERPSRRSYPPAVESRLRLLRAGIVVFEIEGPLFFGSGDRLLDEADALDAGCRWLVLDLRRVGAIDESGAVALQAVVARAAARAIRVELAGLAADSPQARALRSFAPALPQRPDADRAIEAAEQQLLGDENLLAMAEVPLADCALLAGLDAAQRAVVAAHLQPRQLQTGERLFAEGDPGDSLFIVSRGSVSILSRPDRQGRTQRYLSISPGMMIGETALLDGGGRSAGAVADAPTEVHALSREALDDIGRQHPAVALVLHRNIAQYLSQRLRHAAGAWRSSAG